MTFDCTAAATPKPSESRDCTPPPPPPPTKPAPVSMTIEADDNGFYPSTPLSFEKNAEVTITFKVRSQNVYFGGLDFRSPKFSTNKVAPGGSASVSFTADQAFTISSYWPATNYWKADLRAGLKP